MDNGELFTDPEFPPDDQSIYFSKDPPFAMEWKRASEIADDPKLFEGDFFKKIYTSSIYIHICENAALFNVFFLNSLVEIISFLFVAISRVFLGRRFDFLKRIFRVNRGLF